MEHQPSQTQPGTSQKILTDVDVGRDLNATINQKNETYNITNQLDPEQKSIDIHLREQKDELNRQFQKKLDKIAHILSELKSSLELQLKKTSLKDRRKIFELVNQLEDLAKAEKEFKELQDQQKYYDEAAEWLRENTNEIVQYAVTQTFRFNGFPELRENYKTLSISEAKQLFKQDIVSYLEWLLLHIQTGSVPRNIKKNWSINMVLSPKEYQSVFSEVKYNVLAPYEGCLTSEAIQILVIYLNRFLIKRKLEKDI